MKKRWIIHLLFVGFVTLSTNVASNNCIETSTTTGEPGNPNKITRSIKITVIENRFLPSEIDVTQGETIQFIVKSGGNKKHEMIIDSMTNLKKYAKERRTNPDAVANKPNLVQLDPGEKKEFVWKFTKSGSINFACPLPGHFKKMRGKINVGTLEENSH